MDKAAGTQSDDRDVEPGQAPASDAGGAAPSAAEAARHLRSAEEALRQTDRRTLRRARAVYLNGDALDRGTLRLTAHSLRFDGWQGSIVIPVHDIAEVRLGTSVVPIHAGIPLLGWIWPGKPRYAESLLITVRAGTAPEPRVATVADLRDGSQWSDAIQRSRDGYEAWARERARRVAEIETAEGDLARVRQAETPTRDENAPDHT